MHDHDPPGNVFVTGANGYVGNAVAKAFRAAGWKVFGLIRRREDAVDLARHEIHPIVGSPTDLSFLGEVEDVVFDVVVSNTEDRSDAAGHLEHVHRLLDAFGSSSLRAGVKPLVMFTSGCKDYGKMREKHGDAGLSPHTEHSPLDPPPSLEPRAQFGAALLGGNDAPYDATVLRPTIVYGNSSSLYGALFDLAAKSDRILRMVGDPNAVMHSVHVDDCARAYVALAEHPDRSKVAGQAFNVANETYETAREIGEALARSYGLEPEFAATGEDVSMLSVHGLANFWQWVGSDKLRSLTGWRERRPDFVKGLDEYRLAYEAHAKKRA